jgi:hypothetical protein
MIFGPRSLSIIRLNCGTSERWNLGLRQAGSRARQFMEPSDLNWAFELTSAAQLL